MIMHSLFYQNLNFQQKFYDEILNCLQNRKKSCSARSDVNYSELFYQLLGDYPKLFYVKQQFTERSSFFSREIIFDYIYSEAESKKLESDLISIARRIIFNLFNEHQSEYEKVRVLHDYLKSNVQYDIESFENDNLDNTKISEAHTIVGALINRKCVCEGFAKVMKFLCDEAGITCWVISGKANNSFESGPHAWNLVKINGYYHHVDITWDNQYSSNSKIPNYGYFNLSDEEISKDHTWNKRNYPASPASPYNYFRVNNALIDSAKQLENFLTNNFKSEEEFIFFKVVRGSQLEQEIQGSLQDIILRAITRCKYVDITGFHYERNPSQLTFCICPQYNF